MFLSGGQAAYSPEGHTAAACHANNGGTDGEQHLQAYHM